MQDRHIKACLITNPKSGRGGVDLSEALTILQANGWEINVRQKLHGGGATELAQAAVKEGCTVVVDCGGDGTLNEIVEGVMGTDVAVGTLPGGTANLWAHEMGISRNLAVAATQLAAAERRRVDVGIVSVNGKHTSNFVLMAGLGFDGAVIGNISKPLKNRIGPLAYAPAVVAAARTFHSAPIRVRMDDVNWHGRVSQVVVGNTRHYAGFTNITADAFIDDGLLDLCLITASGPLGLTRQLGTMLVRQRPSEASAQTYRAASITIESPLVLPLQVDGGHVDLDDDDDRTEKGVVYSFSLQPQGVCMLVPRTYAGTLFQPSRLADTLTGAPLRPLDRLAVEAEPAHAQDGEHAKERTWRLQVISVGADTITCAKVKNGHGVRVALDGTTTLDDGDDHKPLLGSLSTITPGTELCVTGYKGHEAGTFRAVRVALAGPGEKHNGAHKAKHNHVAVGR